MTPDPITALTDFLATMAPAFVIIAVLIAIVSSFLGNLGAGAGRLAYRLPVIMIPVLIAALALGGIVPLWSVIFGIVLAAFVLVGPFDTDYEPGPTSDEPTTRTVRLCAYCRHDWSEGTRFETIDGKEYATCPRCYAPKAVLEREVPA